MHLKMFVVVLAGVRSVYEEKQIEIIDAQLSKIGGREAVVNFSNGCYRNICGQ